jgi:hypothetical protein
VIVLKPPTLLRDRPRLHQILAAGVAPAVTGVIAGLLIGASAGGYIAWSIVAAVGGFLGGFEHRDGWGGADRGFFGGLIYGIALLLVHALTGVHPKVSLGSFPPLLAVITTIIGTLLGAAGGRIARGLRGDPPRYEPMFRR